MSTPIFRVCPVIGAAALLVGAGWLWNVRQNEAAGPRQLLERTYQADNELQYEALSEVSAYYGTGSMKSSARLVRAPAKMAISYIAGDMAGTQSGYNERWFWRSDKSSDHPYAEVTRRPADTAAQRFSLLLKNYRVLSAGTETINQRAAHVIELHPLNHIDGAQGPYKRLWIDDETGLTLRTDTFNYERRPVMRSVLSEVNFEPQISESTFMPPGKMQKLAARDGWVARDTGMDASAARKSGGIAPPQATWLPPGFELDGYGVHHCPASQENPIIATLSRYTDGLNSLTVFALAPRHNPATVLTTGAAAKACDYGPGTMVSKSHNGIKLVAVGDLPPATLTRVLDKTQIPPDSAASGTGSATSAP